MTQLVNRAFMFSLFILFIFCSSNLVAGELYQYKSLHDIKYQKMPPTFKAEVNGDVYYFALGKSSIPSGINPVDGEDIALESAELKAKGKLAEYINGGQLERTMNNTERFSSTEGSKNSITIHKEQERHESIELKVNMTGGVEVIHTEAFKGKAFVVVAIRKKLIDGIVQSQK